MTTSRMRRAGATLALVAVAGLTVAACSDDDSSDASASEAAKATATSTTATDNNMQSNTADEPATGKTIVDIAASNPEFLDAGDRGQSRRLDGDARRSRTVHGVRTDERRVSRSFRPEPSRPCSNRPTRTS